MNEHENPESEALEAESAPEAEESDAVVESPETLPEEASEDNEAV